jgi:DNA-binding GntR family transcriptional regulator
MSRPVPHRPAPRRRRRHPQQQEDQLTRLLRARLATDDWEPGQRLPAAAALAAEYQAGHGTIRRGLGRPQDEGLIVTLPRYRTFRSRRDRAKG